MKKKAIEKTAKERLSRIEGLEAMLGRRREEIMAIRGEVQGLRELNSILLGMIYQLAGEQGRVEISRAKLREDIGRSFSIEETEDKFIICAGTVMRNENSVLSVL